MRRPSAVGLAAALGLGAPPARAEDAVVLRDGTRVEGRVVAEDPGRSVTIEAASRRRTFAWDVVREVDVARPPASTPPAGAAFRRGLALGLDARATVVAAWTPSVDLALGGTCTIPGVGASPVDRYGVRTSARGSGVGGGLAARVTAAWVSPPAPSVRAWWWAVEASPGVGVAVLRLRTPSGLTPASGELCDDVERRDHPVSFADRAATLVTVPLAIGGRVGLGGFRDGGAWRGFAVGVAWAPSIALLEGHATFAPLGAEIGVDLATLHPRAPRLLPSDAHLRVSATIAAPSGGLGLVTIGVGVAWY
jgi:hypothetical protein